jgi:uncharacterized membrane protein
MDTTSPAVRRTWGPEYLFAGLLAFFGLAFAFGIPPIQTPDEPSHFHRAYQVSEGILFTHLVGEWGGGDVPDSVLHVARRFQFLIFQRQTHTTAEPFRALWAMSLNPDERQTVPFPGASYYSFVPYLPQAIGIAAARAADGGPLQLMYAGRLANLALGVVLVFFAIRIIPIFKLVLGMIALFPIVVQQAASLNPDGSAIPVSFLFVAFVLRCAVGAKAEMGKGDVACLLALAAWLTLCKFPYGLLAFLYLGIPMARLGSRRRYLAVGAALFIVVLALAAVLTQLRHRAPDSMVPVEQGASIAGQTDFIMRHPLRYSRVLAHTVSEHAKVYLDQCSTLGWLDTPVNPLTMYFYSAFLVIVALGDRSGRLAPSRRIILSGLMVAAVCVGVIVTLCYLGGSPLRAPIVNGPQGRYFIPVALFLLLPLHQRVVQVQVDRRVLSALTGAACAGMLIVAMAAIVGRYYFPLDDQRLFSVVGVLIGGTLFALTTVIAWLCCGRTTPSQNEITVLAARVDIGDRGVLAPRLLEPARKM